ncbi:MAG TPA: dienelactone hydrolase family protein [Labilithrix sp.]|nr:dienelactone hydrolase family protein [Labilithrix sp.]
MTTRVTFPSKTGSETSGELAEPSGSGKVPTVVLLQEWWGVNDHIRDLCERLAKEGFLVLAPDLFHGKTTKDASEAAKLMTALDTDLAVKDIAGACAYLEAHPRSNGKVGVVGFCMGGALTLTSACHIEGLSAVAPFYGIPSAEKVDYSKVTAPMMGHYATRDEYIPVDKPKELQRQLEANGKSMELYFYDANHAFANDTRPEVYSAESTKLAWERTVAFFKKHLA